MQLRQCHSRIKAFSRCTWHLPLTQLDSLKYDLEIICTICHIAKLMPTKIDDIIKKLPPAQRRKVEARAAQLIAEEMTLRELRHARKLTQVRVAKTLGISQDSVSRLEKRSDLLLSTLRKTVKAMGGSLSLVAEFPDRAPVVLSGIAEDI